MKGKKRYTVQVTEISHCWGSVEVDAASQEEAEALAEDLFDSATSDEATLEFQTIVMTEDGVPVAWSDEAARLDPANPYSSGPAGSKEAKE